MSIAGIANACTGEEGLAIAEETQMSSKVLNVPMKMECLIGSTGVIGMQIPIDKLWQELKALGTKAG